jgi:hypothetical protein
LDQILLLVSATGSTSIYCLKMTPDGAQDATRTVSGEPAGGWTTTSGAGSIASDGAGTVVIGGTTVNASVEKVASSTDGGNFTVRSLATIGGAGVGVTALIWDSGNSVFVAGANGGSTTTTIETSPDGVTWTNRTNANSNAIAKWAVDGSGTVVGISSASTNKAVRSTDLISWSEVTLPATATWTGITYSAGLGKWFATDGTNSAESSDGVTWSTISMLEWDGTAAGVVLLGSTGNLVIGARTNGDIFVSEDGATFARVGVEPGGSTAHDLWVTSTGIVTMTHDGADTNVRIGAIYHT